MLETQEKFESILNNYLGRWYDRVSVHDSVGVFLSDFGEEGTVKQQVWQSFTFVYIAG